MDDFAEDLKKQIPYYLTQEAGEGLLKELKSYTEKSELLLTREIDGLLQGDGWRGFRVYDFITSESRTIRGLILSNSCDIDSQNPRDIPAKITFVPLIRLSKLTGLLQSSGLQSQQIDAKILDIKKQRSTSFFFIPSQGILEEDYVAWFSDIHSMPAQSFVDSSSKERLFTLNMTGFYLFLFKLSIHFCRFHENVDRFPARA